MKTFNWLFAALAGYVIISLACYAFRHPELTDTQRVLRIVDALLWQ